MQRFKSAISNAAITASWPLLPASPPARASACAMFSHVSTPNAIGVSVSRLARSTPSVAPLHT
jgi:hypothetical protein